MAEPDLPDGRPLRSRAYRDALSKMSDLSDDTLEKVDDIVRGLPADELRYLIDMWFGSDFFDHYADWLEDDE